MCKEVYRVRERSTQFETHRKRQNKGGKSSRMHYILAPEQDVNKSGFSINPIDNDYFIFHFFVWLTLEAVNSRVRYEH